MPSALRDVAIVSHRSSADLRPLFVRQVCCFAESEQNRVSGLVPQLFAAAAAPPSTGATINAPSPNFIIPQSAIFDSAAEARGGGRTTARGPRRGNHSSLAFGRSLGRSFEIRDGRPKFCPLTRITILFAGIVAWFLFPADALPPSLPPSRSPPSAKHVLEPRRRRRRSRSRRRQKGAHEARRSSRPRPWNPPRPPVFRFRFL